jgi:small subunit ribosomal protein S8
MTMSDPIADMCTRVRNGYRSQKDAVEIPASRVKSDIARVLHREGYIRKFDLEKRGNFDVIVMYLKYSREKTPAISGLKRISKPGLRVYTRKDSLPRVLGGLGIAILSTSKGVMTEKEARVQEVGGEVLCYVW